MSNIFTTKKALDDAISLATGVTINDSEITDTDSIEGFAVWSNLLSTSDINSNTARFLGIGVPYQIKASRTSLEANLTNPTENENRNNLLAEDFEKVCKAVYSVLSTGQSVETITAQDSWIDFSTNKEEQSVFEITFIYNYDFEVFSD